LRSAIDDRRVAGKAGGILALVGAINIPIIHYSVDWWNTLHQSASVSKFDNPSIELSMLIPLLCMALAFKLFYVSILLNNSRSELLEQEKRNAWVKKVVALS
jgi:heme exporter protein C